MISPMLRPCIHDPADPRSGRDTSAPWRVAQVGTREPGWWSRRRRSVSVGSARRCACEGRDRPDRGDGEGGDQHRRMVPVQIWEEALRALVLRRPEDLLRRTLLDDHALARKAIDRRPPGNPISWVNADLVMPASRPSDCMTSAPRDHLRIGADVGSVEEHDLRIMARRVRSRRAAAVHLRAARVLVRLLRDADSLEELMPTASAPRANTSALAWRQGDVLERGEVRQVERLEDMPISPGWRRCCGRRRRARCRRHDLASLVLSRRLIVRMKVDLPEPDARRSTTSPSSRESSAAQHVELVEPLVNVAADDDFIGVRIVLRSSVISAPPRRAGARAGSSPGHGVAEDEETWR